jgi:hypothetical protein
MNKKVGKFKKDNKLRYSTLCLRVLVVIIKIYFSLLLDTENTNINTANKTLNELENEDVDLSISEDESELPEE